MIKLLACCIALLISTTAFAAPRERMLMDENWRFQLGDPADLSEKDFEYPEINDLAKAHKDDAEAEAKLAKDRKDPVATHLGESVSWVQPNFDDSKWRQLNLPHDWVVELPFNKDADESHGYHDITATKNNIGWYRKSFDLPAGDKGRSLSIDFDGVYRNCVVWLNDHCLGRNVSGYSSFSYDISSAANYGGKNELVVRVDATRTDGWFYEGAGIYRHVWLVKLAPVHVIRSKTLVTTTYDPRSAVAEVHVDTAIANVPGHLTPDQLTVFMHSADVYLLDASGTKVGTEANNSSRFEGRTLVTHTAIKIPDAHFWSIDDPYLYHAVVESSDDSLEIPFGIRTIQFDSDKGFFLNGKHVFIKGTCNHQDMAGVGTALPDALQYYRLKKLKEMGCNAIRTSHNAPTPELLDACDRIGMLVMDEQRESGDTPEILSQVRRMVLRDRNHPSVILWSIGNEENNIQGNDDVGVTVAKAMYDTIHELDATRPITAAMNGGWGKGFSRVIDVQGFNYPLNTDLVKYHRRHPRQPLLGSEEGSTVSTRGIYTNDSARGYVSAYDLNAPSWACTAERWWNYYQDKAPFMAGAFVWTGFDYRGEPTPYSWPCINSHFGILDTCGFPKDNFYFYQSVWTEKPMVHLLPHWDWAGKEGRPIDVWAYSNCDQLELIVNGKSRGRQDFLRGRHLEWEIPYAPGSLVARGYRDGREVATDKVETTGPPAKLVLTPDRRTINADGEDAVVMTAAVVDTQGRTVPIASNLVKFTVEAGDAKVIGVGNGDPSCHEPDKADQRSAFNGLCMAIIQAGRTGGEIRVTGTAEGLQPASAIVQVTKATPEQNP